MRVLGIDPGYAIIGYGAIEQNNNHLKPISYGAITTDAHTVFEDRLIEIYDDMQQILQQIKPQMLAIESLFFTTNQKTVIAVAQARGVILLSAKQFGIPIYEYSPLQVKQSVTGYGKATKKQVQEMTKRLLGLNKVPKPDDVADALAIGICHAYTAQSLQFGKQITKRQKMGYY